MTDAWPPLPIMYVIASDSGSRITVQSGTRRRGDEVAVTLDDCTVELSRDQASQLATALLNCGAEDLKGTALRTVAREVRLTD